MHIQQYIPIGNPVSYVMNYIMTYNTYAAYIIRPTDIGV